MENSGIIKSYMVQFTITYKPGVYAILLKNGGMNSTVP